MNKEEKKSCTNNFVFIIHKSVESLTKSPKTDKKKAKEYEFVVLTPIPITMPMVCKCFHLRNFHDIVEFAIWCIPQAARMAQT